MQHIGFNIINEQGLLIKRSDINFAEIMLLLFEQKEYAKNFPWLSTVDPYGLTIFNELQTKNLIQDLEKLQSISADTLNNLIKEAIDFIKTSSDLEFIQFIGD